MPDRFIGTAGKHWDVLGLDVRAYESYCYVAMERFSFLSSELDWRANCFIAFRVVTLTNSTENKMRNVSRLIPQLGLLLLTPIAMHAEWGWLAFKVGGGFTQPKGSLERRTHTGYNLGGGLGAKFGAFITGKVEDQLNDL